MQQELEHNAALQAFVSALVEHGEVKWHDEQGRIVMQLTVEPWIFDALCLLGVEGEDLEPEEAS